MSSALEIGNRNYIFNIPKLKVSAIEAQVDCENNGMELATFDEEDQLPKLSHHISMLLDFRGIYEVWHVRYGGQYGFISKNMSRKLLNEYFVNSKNIKVAAKYKDVALYSFVNNSDSKSMELGNYICINSLQNVHTSSAENNSLPDGLSQQMNFNEKNMTTAENLEVISFTGKHNTFDKISPTYNSNDTLAGLSYGISILGLLIGCVFFVVLMVSLTLYFVHRKRNNKK